MGGVLAAALIAVLLRLATSWLFALPLVLFDRASPSRALRVSGERATGHRSTLLLWIAGWALASTALSTLATWLVVLLGRVFVPLATGSLGLVVLAVGVTLGLWAGTNLAVNLLSTTTFATMLLGLYRQFGSQGSIDRSRLTTAAAAGRDAGFALTRRNQPALARTVLQQRARMSPAERLLLELAGILGVVPEIGEP